MDVNNREIFCLGCFNVFRFCDCIDSYDVDGLLNGDDNEKERDKDDGNEIENPDPELERFNPGQPGPVVVTPSPKKRKPPKMPPPKPQWKPPTKHKVRPGKQTTLTDEYTDYNPTDGKTPYTPPKRKDPPQVDPFDDTAVPPPVSQKPRVDPSTLTDYGDGVTFVDRNDGSPTFGQKFDKNGYPAGPLGRPVEDVYFRPDRSESTKKLEDMEDEILATPENFVPNTKKQICVLGGPPLTTWLGPDGWPYGKDEAKDGPVTWEDVYFPERNEDVGKFPEGRMPPEDPPSALPIGIVDIDVRSGGKGAKLPYAPPYFFPDTGIEPTYTPIVPIVPPEPPVEDPCPPHRNNVCNTVGLTGVGTLADPFIGGNIDKRNMSKFAHPLSQRALNQIEYAQNRYGNLGDAENEMVFDTSCRILTEMKNEQSPSNPGYYGIVKLYPLTNFSRFNATISGYGQTYLDIYLGDYVPGAVPMVRDSAIPPGQHISILIPPVHNNKFNSESPECFEPFIVLTCGVNDAPFGFSQGFILRKTTTEFIEYEITINPTLFNYKKQDGTNSPFSTGGKNNIWPQNWSQINQRADAAPVSLNDKTTKTLRYLGYATGPFAGTIYGRNVLDPTTFSTLYTLLGANSNKTQWIHKRIPNTVSTFFVDNSSTNIIDSRVNLNDIINWID